MGYVTIRHHITQAKSDAPSRHSPCRVAGRSVWLVVEGSAVTREGHEKDAYGLQLLHDGRQ